MSEILLTSRYLSVRRLDLTGVCLKKKKKFISVGPWFLACSRCSNDSAFEE